ncbi:hypothetical protein EVAR_77719_1 [Eumeta japonica]|uniref:Clip domain-containing protein n=1 Tax=Eumeta variegata TaxID=151549 RepID=A0A4C1TBT2_EUMVA|nr:hypothetical protein EVAR_77719_1 [Eumeta japonica]
MKVIFVQIRFLHTLIESENKFVYAVLGPPAHARARGNRASPPRSTDLEITSCSTTMEYLQASIQLMHIFQETCTTAAGGLGSCIVLTACDDLYSKLRDRPSDSAVVSELRAAHCGFQGTDPKVARDTLAVYVGDICLIPLL